LLGDVLFQGFSILGWSCGCSFSVLSYLFFVLDLRWSRAMNDQERHQLHELLETKRKRLRVREQQAAAYGINVPPEVQDVDTALPSAIPCFPFK
jgi:hypothetical protein